jgi:undecaprenyl-diphosphatase
LPLIHAIVLGIVQGLSEFLPISSSGHLLIVPWLFGWTELTSNPELNRTFDVALHVGTFVAVVAYFWRDLWTLAGAWIDSWRFRDPDLAPWASEDRDARLAWLLILASVPAALVGVVLDKVLEGHTGGFVLVGVMLIVFAVVLYLADRLIGVRKTGDFTARHALLMGAAQATALQPGVSRSGATISMGRFLGYERDAAARISFLMSVPITGGAGAYKALSVFLFGDGLPPGFAAPFFWGMVASGVTGFVAVWGLMRLIRTRTFLPFVVYRIVLGVFVIGVALTR